MSKVNEKSKVRVYNNVFNSVGFETASGRHVELLRNGAFKDVSVEDIDYIISVAPAMITEGILYIKNKEVRQFLDIEDYYNDGSIILSSDLEDILKQEPDELKKTLKNASKSAKRTVAKKAKEKADSLTGGQVKAIEDETNVNIDDKF